jgi:CubicO group peptidase (beta-lactamase class C family)
MIDQATVYLENAIKHRVFPGCSIGIIAFGKQWCRGLGKFTYDEGAAEVREDSVYDVASITKSVPLGCLAMMLIERGAIGPDDRLIDILPEFTGGYRASISIRHLLTHTLDFGFQLSAFRHLNGDELMKLILSAPLRSEPGRVFSYANATSILLGLVIERTAGLPLDKVADNLLFRPLGMERTTFFPEVFDAAEVAPTEYDSWRGRMVRAEVHDESAFALRPKAVGSAGLFSTAPDLLKIVAMLLAGGSYAGRNILSPETIAAMHSNGCPVAGACTGLGWELNQSSFMGKKCGSATFGKTGFTGCSMVIDPMRKAGMVLLSNHTFPERHNDRSLINDVRSGLADLVFTLVDTVR